MNQQQNKIIQNINQPTTHQTTHQTTQPTIHQPTHQPTQLGFLNLIKIKPSNQILSEIISFVGGNPIFISPLKKQTNCKTCDNKLILLLQVFI